MSAEEDIRADVRAANMAQQLFSEAMLRYQRACVIHDWKAAEMERTATVGHFEAYLDHLAAAYKRME